jgi:hypothetical protein
MNTSQAKRPAHLRLAPVDGVTERSSDTAAHPPAQKGAASADSSEVALYAGFVGAAAPMLRDRSSGSGLSLRHAGSELPAHTAASCLLQAAPGDLVTYSVLDGRAYVLHVLRRAETEGARPEIRLPADTLMTVASGELSVRADRVGVQADDLTVSTERVEFRAREAQSVVERAFSVIGQLDAVWTGVKLAGTLWRSVFDRHESHAQNHQRSSTGSDHVQAAVVDVQAEQLACTRAENVAVDARTLVKLRGGQVHIG